MMEDSSNHTLSDNVSESSLHSRGPMCLAHLPLPLGAQVIQNSIPYCSTAGYDHGSFLGYPARAGWPHALPSETSPSFARIEKTNPSDHNRLEEFLQMWLFFGLLHEILGSRYDETRYVMRDENGATVHTTNLEQDIRDWATEAESLALDEDHKLYLHFHKCLSVANEALDVTVPAFRPGFNRNIRQSIALLCEAVAHAVDRTLAPAAGYSIPMNWGVAYNDPQIIAVMRANNWCHSEIILAQDRMGSASSVYYMERMIKPDLGRDHSTCSQDQCQYLTIDDQTYRTQHVKGDCDCEEVSISLESLASALEAGSVPLLRLNFNNDSTLDVTIVSDDSDKAYVALSHVWADGLGNKKGNSLPTCQIRRLAVLLQRLHAQLSSEDEKYEHKELLFWCDTLCVPVQDAVNSEQNRLRGLAMQRMRRVYQQASYVLVLDRTFEPFKISEIGLTEAAFRVMTSPWTQRLWTYQEAVLPENLRFQFADMTVDIRNIGWHHQKLSRSNVVFHSIALDIIKWCAMIRNPFHAGDGNTLGFNAVASSLKGRRVSVPTDEALCLATVYDLDVSRIRGTRQERMREFWKAMSKSPIGIPRTMILNTFPRLHEPGFRWAPSTLLNDQAILANLWASMGEDTRRHASLSEDGLLIDLPSFRVRRASRVGDIALDEPNTSLDVQNMVQLRDIDENWYNLKVHAIHDEVSLTDIFEMLAKENSEIIAIVKNQLGVERGGVQQQTGLLTKPIKSPSGTQILQSVATIVLTSMHEREQIPWRVAHALATYYVHDSGSLAQSQSQNQTEAGTDPESAESASRKISSGGLLLDIMRYTSVLLEQDLALLQLMQNMGQQQAPQYLAFMTLRVIRGQYLAVVEKFDAGKMWCVD